MANMHFKADLLPSTDLGYSLGSSNERWKINGLTGGPIEYIVGTQTASTGSWTGITKDPTLVTGKVIAYKLPYAGSGSASLTLTYTNPPTGEATNSGAIPVYLNNTRATTHYAANSVIIMVYDGTNWRSTDYWNSNSRDAGYGKINLTQSTSIEELTTNTTQIAAHTYNEAMTLAAGNKWVQFAGTSSNTNGADVLTVAHSLSGVTPSSYGDSSNQTPAYGGTFNVPYITVDAAGHVTAISTHTVKIPASDNTNNAVTQTNQTGNNDYRILLSGTANDTTATEGANKSTNLRFNPSTKVFSVGGDINTTGDLTIAHATTATMTSASTNPKITFSENGTQPVHLIYSDYDSYRSPAGLKVIGGENATPAWFEVEGNIYAAAFKGNADTATTATKLGTTTLGSSTKPIYLSSGAATECSTYAGGTAVTLNNASKAGSTASFYAPTAGGTANTQALVGNGATTAPKWVDISPSITITAGDASNAPKINVTVLGRSGTAQAITTASTSVYGVTKLSSAINSTSTTLAATASAVKSAYDLAAGKVSKSGDTMTGTLTTHGLVGTLDIDYGEILPTSAVNGQVFFQLSDGYVYELPASGAVDEMLVKNSATDRDVKWTRDYVKRTGDTMSGNLLISKNDTSEAFCRSVNSNGAIELLASTNRGLYDRTNSKWIIYLQISDSTVRTHYQLYGAVWNDYAEFRETKEKIEPGRCIKEIGNDTLELTTERLQRGCEIVSDTFGFAIGQSEKAKTPTAASGRVLAYLYEDRELAKEKIGWPVCSGPNGTVSIMTEEEEMKYPSRIIGTISSVPDYEEWAAGDKDQPTTIKVNGRIWIRVK